MSEGIEGEFDSVQNPAQRGLPMEVKERIVILFAQYQSLSTIIKVLREEFGLVLDNRTITNYNPSTPRSRIGKRLREIHAAAREAWAGQSADIGIALQGQRLRLIERAVAGAERSKDWGNVAKLLELAAKEMGGTLTNVSRIEHKGQVDHRHLSVEDARAELVARLSGALDGGVLQPVQSLPKPLETEDNPSDLT